MRRLPSPFFVSLIVLSACASALGAQTNRTIDDQLGDSVTGAKPVYSPTNFTGAQVWKGSNECSDCAITPDSTKTFNNTWTSATYFPAISNMSIAFDFQGTDIYIFFVQSNYPTSTGLVSSTSCDFHLDGQEVGSYQHITDGTYVFQYNVLVYSQTSIPPGNHSFLIDTTSFVDDSYVIFDYAMYTIDQVDVVSASSSSSATTTATSFVATVTGTASSAAKKKPAVGAIVGGVVGGVVGVALVAAAMLCYRRRGRRNTLIPRRDMIDLSEGAAGAASIGRQDDLSRQIARQRQALDDLERNGQRSRSGRNEDGLDVAAELEQMRAQIRRLEAQQHSIWGSSSADLGIGSTEYTAAPVVPPAMVGISTTFGDRPTHTTTRSLSTMKRDQTSAVQETTSLTRTLLHSDSGLRLNSQSGLIELPPTYAAD